MRIVSNALRSASAEAAATLTHKIRAEAVARGWSPEVADSLIFSHDGKKFTFTIHPDHKSRALDHEFGTETTPPNPVIRKFLSNPQILDTHVGKAFNKKWVR